MDDINKAALLLHVQTADIHSRDKKLQAKKLRAIEKFFPNFDYRAIKIPEENINRAKELLPDFKAFLPVSEDLFFELLCFVPAESQQGKKGA